MIKQENRKNKRKKTLWLVRKNLESELTKVRG